jgi:hypothetical protein
MRVSAFFILQNRFGGNPALSWREFFSTQRISSDLEKTLGEFERKTLLLRLFMGLGE